MTEKKKRLLPMQSPPDLYEVIGEYDPDNKNFTFKRRRRDGGASEKNNPWVEFDVKEEGLNTSLYVYHLSAGPRLRLVGKVVQTYDPNGEYLDDRPVEYVRRLSELARRWRKARKGKGLYVNEGSEDAETFVKLDEIKKLTDEESYDIIIHSDGQVNVGCQNFPWEVIDTFAKKNGWWK